MNVKLPKNNSGMGGGNMQSMLRQAQKMQEDMAALQAELETREYEVSAGGGMVKVTITGKKEIKAMEIQPEIVDPDDIETLADVLTAAVNEATAEVVESADGNGNLAHVRDAHGRCPDLLIHLPKGASLVKVGAGKFDVVVSPVASDRPNGPQSPDASHHGTGGGNNGGNKPDDLK